MIVSYDQHLSFAKLLKACSYAKKPDNIFLATNEDAFLPTRGTDIVYPGSKIRSV